MSLFKQERTLLVTPRGLITEISQITSKFDQISFETFKYVTLFNFFMGKFKVHPHPPHVGTWTFMEGPEDFKEGLVLGTVKQTPIKVGLGIISHGTH